MKNIEKRNATFYPYLPPIKKEPLKPALIQKEFSMNSTKFPNASASFNCVNNNELISTPLKAGQHNQVATTPHQTNAPSQKNLTSTVKLIRLMDLAGHRQDPKTKQQIP